MKFCEDCDKDCEFLFDVNTIVKERELPEVMDANELCFWRATCMAKTFEDGETCEYNYKVIKDDPALFDSNEEYLKAKFNTLLKMYYIEYDYRVRLVKWLEKMNSTSFKNKLKWIIFNYGNLLLSNRMSFKTHIKIVYRKLRSWLRGKWMK